MLSFEKFWERMAGANPKLTEAGNLTLSTSEFRRLMEKAYAAGCADHRQLVEDCEKLRPKSPLDSLFNPFGF
jgi:hypothetical protein